MKLQQGETSMDLDFQSPQPGISVCQLSEGIKLFTNQTTSKTSLQIPMEIVEVIDGPKENMGLRLTHFIPIETEFGERQLNNLLTMTGLIQQFSERFSGDIEPTDEKFITTLSMKLPGKLLKVKHDTRKDNQDKERANIRKVEQYGPKTKPTPTANNNAPEDW